MNPYPIIEIPNKNAYWRADQIAGIELSGSSLFAIPTAMPERHQGYVYNKTTGAEQAFKKLLEDWRTAIQGPLAGPA